MLCPADRQELDSFLWTRGTRAPYIPQTLNMATFQSNLHFDKQYSKIYLTGSYINYQVWHLLKFAISPAQHTTDLILDGAIYLPS